MAYIYGCSSVSLINQRLQPQDALRPSCSSLLDVYTIPLVIDR